MTPTEVALAFVDAINKKDIEQLSGLMSENHKFIDGDGTEHSSKEQMTEGWKEHLTLIPDLFLSISMRFQEGNIVVLIGSSKGTLVQNGELKTENSWEVPCAWRVLVESDKVVEWQLYANQCALHEIYDRINTDLNSKIQKP